MTYTTIIWISCGKSDDFLTEKWSFYQHFQKKISQDVEQFWFAKWCCLIELIVLYKKRLCFVIHTLLFSFLWVKLATIAKNPFLANFDRSYLQTQKSFYTSVARLKPRVLVCKAQKRAWLLSSIIFISTLEIFSKTWILENRLCDQVWQVISPNCKELSPFSCLRLVALMTSL